MEQVSLPILPIPNVVFFPHTSIPVLIVEPVYINMIKNCIQNNLNLGICMAEPVESFSGQVKYRPQMVGTMGRPLIIDEYDDGSIKILVRGLSRIQLESVEQNLPHLIYRVSFLPDLATGGIHRIETGVIDRLRLILESWVEETIPDSLERESFCDSITGLHPIVDYLCMFLIQDTHMRQILLENRYLHERIQIVNSLLQGNRPQHEDLYVLQAIKNFEVLEQTFAVAH